MSTQATSLTFRQIEAQTGIARSTAYRDYRNAAWKIACEVEFSSEPAWVRAVFADIGGKMGVPTGVAYRIYRRLLAEMGIDLSLLSRRKIAANKLAAV